MTFHVIDKKTGKEPTDRMITNIARKGKLMEADIDGFYIGEDGEIVLADDCGNATWVNRDRFKVVLEEPINTIRRKIEREADYYDANINRDIAEGLYKAIEIIDKELKHDN